MLEIKIPAGELYNESNNEFIYTKAVTIYLEHSLIALSKWESKYEKPFLDDKDKTNEEIMDYIKCMTITKGVDPFCYMFLGQENIDRIQKYIDTKSTATTIREKPSYGPKPILTSEVIYAMMIESGIPLECEKWHLNRLIMLIRVCRIRNTKPEKMSKSDMIKQRRELNAQRLKGKK